MASEVSTVCITSGDSDGIGLEVSVKALLKVGPKKKIRFALFLSNGKLSKCDTALLRRLQSKFKISNISVEEFQASAKESSSNLLLIRSSLAPARWVEISAQACMDGKAAALCTAPLSKPGIRAAGLKDLGHTEILQRVCGVSQANMCFLGDKFNVVLATAHLPLADVPSALNQTLLRKTLINISEVLTHLPSTQRKKPLGILGLNPHASDDSLIGDFEKSVLRPLIEAQQKAGLAIQGPLIPDVAFQPSQWKRFSFYVALYHDQGLIPFKMVHGFDSGVHLTLGLPICRTSVDHGTAKDIYGRGIADAGSMKDALLWATKVALGGGWKGNRHV